MILRKLAIGASVLALTLGAIACGGDDDTNSGDRPSVEEISEAFAREAPGAPAEAADCFAERLEGSELPNGVLRALVAGEEPEIDADNEDSYNGIVDDAVAECSSALGGG